jgi:cytochrome c peroxidase
MKTLVTTTILILFADAALAGSATHGDGAALPLAVTDAAYHDDGSPSEAKVELGRALFFDKILSGNRNISCATCHHPTLGTGDALALPLGEGPAGLGPKRRAGTRADDAVHERVPRNSPALFNLGAREFTVMFHDGRVEVDENGYYESGFISPARWKLPAGLDNALAAQAMFPVTSHAEMAGQQGENEIADAKARANVSGKGGVWELLAARLAAVPEYVELFRAAYPEQVKGSNDVTFVQAANAIAAFEASAFRADDSPFDRHLRGEEVLPDDARRGLELFYGEANCSSCHSGPFQTDHDFHAIAMPQIGPGKSDGWNSEYWSATGIRAFPEDFGRGRVTTKDEDRYAFRTPSLRNVELTGPWGHAGAYASLEDVVRHHLDPLSALERYELDPDALPPIESVLELTASGSRLAAEPLAPHRLAGFLARDTWVQSSETLRNQIAQANQLPPLALSDGEVADLLAFLASLTDAGSRDLSALVPERVPSGLSIED